MKKITISHNGEDSKTVVFTVDELVEYSGYKKSYIYKLAHQRKIPHYKPPFGRKLFFKKDEVDSWLTANRQLMVSEL